MSQNTKRLILAVFIGYMVILGCGRASPTPEPTHTPAPPTNTPVPPTSTPLPTSTSSPKVELGPEQQSETGGFAFRTVSGYTVAVDMGFANVAAPGADADAGPSILMMGGPNAQETTLKELYDKFMGELEVDEHSEPSDVKVGGVPGLVVQVKTTENGKKIEGRIVIVAVTPMQQFVMLGVTPQGQWDAFAAPFDATLASVRFFKPAGAEAPSGANPTATPSPATGGSAKAGWSEYTNANYVSGMALDGRTLWAATNGGVVAWNLDSGESVRYTVLDGLPTNYVNDITVCPLPDPIVLAGTELGLVLYEPESNRWEVLSKEETGMSRIDVEVLDCDPDTQRLFVGYTFSLDVYDAKKDKWTFWDKKAGLASDFVNHITPVGDDLWVASSFGVSVIHADGAVTIYHEDMANSPDHTVESIAADDQGNIWLAAFDGLLKFRDDKWTLYNSDAVKEFPFLDAFMSVQIAPDGMVWIGNVFGTLCQFDPAAEKCLAIYDNEEGMVADLKDMLLDAQGHLYYSDDNEGISIFDGTNWRMLIRDELPVGNSYNAIAFTPDGTIWLGSPLGLQTLSAAAPDAGWKYNKMDNNPVYTFFLSQKGIWIGHGAGASFAPYGTDTWTNVPKGEAGQGILGSPTAITEDGAGRLWFGSGQGLTMMQGDTFTYNDLLSDAERGDKQSPRAVYALLYDGNEVWVGAQNALFRIDKNAQITRLDEIPGISNTNKPTVYALALDQDGHMLLNVGRRLLRYQDGAFKLAAETPGEIQSILVTEQGEIWLGMRYNGVFRYDGSEWRAFTSADGLPSSYFGSQSIAVDNLGSVWFAAKKGGLARYIP